ncbi:unnamed protein product [Ceratitis capitata]|uniref:(Mediterranean fruit fly) hypothetical protein n=1 Tax=Ceratitis capitata TaxID=7213 RepID=A0A811U1R0_CERCA|nr:unnamed protein product [Ceratitis capitata]
MIKIDEEGDESGQLANTSTTDHANAGAEQISADTTGKRKNIDDPCDGSTNTNCSSIDGVASMETAGGQRTKYAKYEPPRTNDYNKNKCKELGKISKEGLKKPEESTNSTNVAGTGPITDETQPSGQSVEKKSTDAAADPAIETPQDVAAHKNPVNDTNPIKEGDTSNKTPLQESLPATSTPSVEPNLSLVKQEVMSDEEEAVGVPYSTASISSSQQEVSTSSTLGDVAVDNQSGVMTTNLLPDAVRVGETMIQRVNTKNLRNSQPSLVALKPVEKATQESSAVMDGLTPGSSAMHFNQPNKRPNTRGVPYGPLPASAIITQQSQPPKSVASSNTASRMILQQQQQQNLSQLQSQTQTQSSSQTQPQLSSQTSPQSTSQVQSESSQAPLQRARKSFPNRSTPDISTIRGNGSNLPLPPPALPPPITSSLTNNNDLKRTLLKNSMVSIPRQAWSPHDQQRNANIVISNTNTNSIPVPPLTAVSKTSTALTVLSTTAVPVSTPI